MNVAQQHYPKASGSSTDFAGSSNHKTHNQQHQKQNKGHNSHVMDPVLPKFESSETSQGPLYDLSFELSNQNALKPNNNNQYSYSIS